MFIFHTLHSLWILSDCHVAVTLLLIKSNGHGEVNAEILHFTK